MGITCPKCECPMSIDYWDNGVGCWINPDSLELHCSINDKASYDTNDVGYRILGLLKGEGVGGK
jgi:hypothetical protein